jgi:Mg-chelatase subunit ChlD
MTSNQTYSVVQFATNATLVTSLTSSVQALDALDKMIYTGGLTNHAEAIALCQKTLQLSDNRNAQNLIMLVTDGDPSEPKATSPELEAMQAADEAESSGIFIIPVMIARTLEVDTWEYMREISSDGSVFNVTDFKSLEMLQESLIAQVSCQT